MQITLEITSEAQAELRRRAAASGRDLEGQAISLLEEALHVQTPHVPAAGEPHFGKRLVEVFQMIQGLADDVDFSPDRSPGRPVDLS